MDHEDQFKNEKGWVSIISLGFGIASIFLWEFSIVPILAIIFGGIGLVRDTKRGMAVIGTILGIIFITVRIGHGFIDRGYSENVLDNETPQVFETPTEQMPLPIEKNDSPPTKPLIEKTEEIGIVIGSTEIVASNTPVRFSKLSIYPFGSTVTNDFGYNPYMPASTLGQYIKVTFTTSNLSKAEQAVVLDNFQLKDQQERVYIPSRAYNCEGALNLGAFNRVSASLKPDISCDWSMLFEVSKDSNSYTLSLNTKPCTESWCAYAAMKSQNQ